MTRLFRTGLLLGLLVLLAAPLQVQERRERYEARRDRRADPTDVRDERNPYTLHTRIDRHSERRYTVDRYIVALGGNRYHVQGSIFVALDLHQLNDGRIRVTGNAHGNDLVVQRASNRFTYDVSGTDRVDTVLPEPTRGHANLRYVVDFPLAGRGDAPDARIYLTVEGTVNRDGGVVARVTDIRITER